MRNSVLIRMDSLAHPRTGIGYYTEHLVRAMQAEPGSPDIVGLYRGRCLSPESLNSLLTEPIAATGSRAIRNVLSQIPGAYAARGLWCTWRDARAARAHPHQLFHEPAFIPPPTRGPLVITVLDLSHLRYPQFHPAARVRFLRERLPGAIARADHIITISESVKRELAEYFPASIAKTTAIPLGVAAEFGPRNASMTRPTLRRWRLRHRGYLLSVATLEPRKNLAGLVRAYRQLPPELASDLPLVLTGAAGWKNHELKQLLGAPQAKHPIIVTGRVERSELINLIAGARMLAYPSFYEGFGLPIAEAQACGVPVLTTHSGAMQEVAGDRAFLVDPHDFGEALRQALELSERDLLARAPPRARPWRDTAVGTLAVYRKVVGR